MEEKEYTIISFDVKTGEITASGGNPCEFCSKYEQQCKGDVFGECLIPCG